MCGKMIYCESQKISESKYAAHIWRSHPFKCISLPLWGIFFFILYWFALIPLIYVYLNIFYAHELANKWIITFWLIAFAVFIILLSILICLWRCNTNYNKIANENAHLLKPPNTGQTIELQTIHVIYNENNSNDNVTKHESRGKELTEINGKEDMNSEKLFPRCSVKRRIDKKRPVSVNLTPIHDPQKYRSLYYGDLSPLSPRELFFHDLIRSANQSENNLTNTFLEKERAISLQNNLTILKSDKENDINNTSQEFFIANVTTPENCANEVFLFIDESKEDKKLVIKTLND